MTAELADTETRCRLGAAALAHRHVARARPEHGQGTHHGGHRLPAGHGRR